MSIYNFLDDIGLTRVFEKLKAKLDAKQDTLVSGTNIKTINNTSLLGSGNIDINEVFVAVYEQTSYADVKAAIDAHKVIVLDMPANNNQFCITFSTYTNGGNALMYAIYKMNDNSTLITATLTPQNQWSVSHTNLQDRLISGTNIKTINNVSLLGEGNISTDNKVYTIIEGTTSASEIRAAWYGSRVIGIVEQGKTFYEWIAVNIAEPTNYIMVLTCISKDTTNPSFIQFALTNDVWSRATVRLQTQLISGSNIKTVNNQSLLGSGNIDIPSGGTVDTVMSDTSENAVQNKVIKAYVDGATGDLSTLTTDNKTNLVSAINEVYEKSGEPFRVKNWGASNLNVSIPYCTEEIANTSIAKMTYSIDAEEGASYQIVGMIAYEVFDSSNQRINCWPVCQFTGNGQKELSVRWACMGSSRKTATKINAWVLLKHR